MTCRDGTGRDGTGQLATRTPWDSLQSILVSSAVKTTPRSCKNLTHCPSSVKPNSDSTKEAGIVGRYLQHTHSTAGGEAQGNKESKITS